MYYIIVFSRFLFSPHSSHNRHCVAIGVERGVFKFRLLRGAGHVPADRIVLRRADPIPGRHGAHAGVRLHLVQSAAGQVAVRHCGRHRFHAVPAHLHAVYGTRPIQTGNSTTNIIITIPTQYVQGYNIHRVVCCIHSLLSHV